MFIRSIGFLKFLALLLVCGLLSACQTSGLKPGSIQTSYAPSGWTKRTANGITGYVCHVPRCKSDRAIGYGPIRIRGNFEEAIKSNEFSPELFNAISNVYTIASKGQWKLRATRRIVRKDYAGLDFAGYVPTRSGRVYAKGRLIVQNNRASALFALARSQGLANSYFSKYMGATSIKRIP
ncbi:hypothetical protein [Roseibium aggregatum]|uniref:Lipoprotein n=1 Tax=Roseibium aggregatum TaxID=187304 RepID=A0A939EEG6_9HYPH|nr:hypothetical protein [Roseibium aggregatum]MBN9671284.1 hypothetical protein [Roseibium aggregatum]